MQDKTVPIRVICDRCPVCGEIVTRPGDGQHRHSLPTVHFLKESICGSPNHLVMTPDGWIPLSQLHILQKEAEDI